MNLETMLTTAQAAAILNVTPRTMRSWRTAQSGPDWVQVGGSARYLPSAIQAWLDGHSHPGVHGVDEAS